MKPGDATELTFTALERAALAAFASYFDERHPALARQIALTCPVEREVTGIGFFLKLSGPPPDGAEVPSSEVLPFAPHYVDIERLDGPFCLVLHNTNGRARLLEGWATDGTIEDIDLSNVVFGKIEPAEIATK